MKKRRIVTLAGLAKMSRSARRSARLASAASMARSAMVAGITAAATLSATSCTTLFEESEEKAIARPQIEAEIPLNPTWDTSPDTNNSVGK
ncbi:MAG: hypothetical protein SNI45_08340 [Rikenellaceae bacterium]